MTLIDWASFAGVRISNRFVKRIDPPQRFYGATRHGIIETGKRKGQYAESPRRFGLPGRMVRYETL